MEFSGQEQWSWLPHPPPGDPPDPEIDPGSPALAGGFFATEPPGKCPSLSPRGLQIPPYVGFLGTGQVPVCSPDQAFGRFEMRWTGRPLGTRKEQNKKDGCTTLQKHSLEKYPSLLSWFFLFFFNWRIMALQYYVGLHHTST